MAMVVEPLEYDLGSYAGVGGSEKSLIVFSGEDRFLLLSLSSSSSSSSARELTTN